MESHVPQPRQRLDINHNIGQAQYIYIITEVKGAMAMSAKQNQNVFPINHVNFLDPSDCILIQCWS